jgi:transcriptional regulator with XRE-family HTH domain
MATTKFDIPEDFPKQLRNFRETYDLSQARLAEMLGVATNYVGMLEAGTRRPSGRLYRAFEELRYRQFVSHDIEGLAAAAAAISEEKRAALQRGTHGQIADLIATPQTEPDMEVAAKLAERPADLCRKMADPELLQYHSEFLSQMVDESRQVFRATHATMLEAIANEFDARLRTARTT